MIALLSLLVGVAMPAMEFIPFSANLAGIVLTGFGLALAMCDGLLALLVFLIIASSSGLLVWQLLW